MTVAAFPALGYDPAPGSAEAIRALAADCRHVAGQLAAEAHTLTGIGSTGWTGSAALAFAGQLNTLPADLRSAAHSFTLTAQAIDRYAAELADTQLAARRAEAAAHAARQDQRIARAAVDAATDPAGAAPARRRLAAADQDLAAARRHAQHTRDQARSAAQRAAAAVRDASRWAPRKPHESVFERLGGAIADGWAAVTDNVHHWVVEHAEVLRQISAALSTVSAISGTLALAICWVPVVGQAAAGALGTLAAVTGGVATATNALLAANGQAGWTSVAVDLGLTALGGAGKAASKTIAASRAAKAASKSGDVAAEAATARHLEAVEVGFPNAHGHSRHGAQTTLQQQMTRARTGLTPDGAQKAPSDASRFFTHQDELRFLTDARAAWTSGTDQLYLRYDHYIGEGYLRGATDPIADLHWTQEAKVFFDSSGNPKTWYPLLWQNGR